MWTKAQCLQYNWMLRVWERRAQKRKVITREKWLHIHQIYQHSVNKGQKKRENIDLGFSPCSSSFSSFFAIIKYSTSYYDDHNEPVIAFKDTRAPSACMNIYSNEFNYLSHYYLWLNKHHNTHAFHACDASKLKIRANIHTAEAHRHKEAFPPPLIRGHWFYSDRIIWTLWMHVNVRYIYSPLIPTNSHNLKHNLIFQFNLINCMEINFTDYERPEERKEDREEKERAMAVTSAALPPLLLP